MGILMTRWKFELHLPFLVIGVEDMQLKLRKYRTRNLTESPNPLLSPPGSTGRFVALRDGSTVGYYETIEGVVAGLAPDSEAWILVYPVREASYWPQYGVPVGQAKFKTPTRFGRGETKDAGEKFILLLVVASQDASVLFHGFRVKDATSGLPALPPGTQTLARIAVTRKLPKKGTFSDSATSAHRQCRASPRV
jgi:hypothetical protein